jgi:hypothetical protein
MTTKREYLVSIGMAKGGRGRFSAEAKEALQKAIDNGMVFDEPVIVVRTERERVAKPVKVSAPSSSTYDAKAIRSWAEQTGAIAKGQRGRLPTDIINAYLSQNSTIAPKAVPRAKVVRVRSENVGWTFSRRRDGDPTYISEPLVAVTSCGKCSRGIGYCGCASGPVSPKYLGSEILSLTKPAV